MFEVGEHEVTVRKRPAVDHAWLLAPLPEVVVLGMITSAKRRSWASDVSLTVWKRAGLSAPLGTSLQDFQHRTRRYPRG